MIVKNGVDVVNVSRIKGVFERFGERFVQKILHEEEINLFHVVNNKPRYLAKRFSAKESVAKAFGFGIGKILSFHDIIVRHDEFGAPFVVVPDCKWPALKVGRYTRHSISLSISDDEELVVSSVVIVMF
ncbi:holo-ACP synthase [Candidatus Sneabacter namystus]|uniref:Holo-[acyl-carrier-protein] synthase n=1 Tax=Candidatus Sneabacter namystus TaxID=2601646 RepID=A0A5C0UHQ2_9RICK|nr:holo-ACP synthase [Candidatus Sneabacter namystus]QEK39556.1 holo-[acyl-carrier-protein] synthase [Candidatus Sneabacter namystus]